MRMSLIYQILDGKLEIDKDVILTEKEENELMRLGYCGDCKGKCKTNHLDSEFEKLNLLNPTRFLSKEEFIKKWTK